MTRLLLIIAVIAALAAGAAWVADNPGTVRVEFEGTVAETTFAALALMIAALMALAALVTRVWHWLRRGFWDRRLLARHKRGYDQLAWGMSALMAGDGRRARQHARKFEQLVGHTPLADVLAGEAAMMQGELGEARTRFQALESDRRTEALALRGLLAVADRGGKKAEVLETARTAAIRLPKASWAQSGLFEAAVATRDWDAAVAALGAAMRSRHVDPQESKRQLATLRYCQARDAVGDGRLVRDRIREALDLNPDLIPARLMAADLATKEGHRRRATALLKTGWQRNPHPSLAAAWKDLEKGESPAQAYKRLETLTRTNPDHPESHFALANAAHAAELHGSGRRHLEAMIKTAPQARAFALLEKIENATGHEDAAAGARISSLGAAADPAWHCTHCGHAVDTWTEKCPECGTFAPFAWSAMSVSLDAPPAPLSTGAPTSLLHHDKSTNQPNERQIHTDLSASAGDSDDARDAG